MAEIMSQSREVLAKVTDSIIPANPGSGLGQQA